MRARTGRYDRVVVGSHTIAAKASLLYGKVPVTGADALNIVSGSIDYNRSQAVMATAQIRLAEPLRVPTLTSPGQLAPYGYELALFGGIAYSDGTSELLPLGVFPIQLSNFDGTTLLASLDLEDRSRLVIDALIEDDYEIAAGTNYATAIQALVAAGVPGLTYAFTSTPHVTPPVMVLSAGANRWEQAQQMAKSIGCELFFNGFGYCVLREEPGALSAPVWTFAEGAAGLLIEANLTMDRGPAYNRTIAYGSNPSSTFIPRGVATDPDPFTGYDSPFGRKPAQPFSSPYITTDLQAQQVAIAIQAANSGVARGLSLRGVPNFALEPGDVVRITRTTIGVNEFHILDAFSIGLTAADEMGLAA